MAGTKFDKDHTLQQLQNYQVTPKYISHGSGEDRLAILVCKIKVWKPKDNKWFDIPKDSQCLVIREVESIEIAESYKDLIGKAVLRFPRGTIVEKHSTGSVIADDGDGALKAVPTRDATASGDFLEYSMQSVNSQQGSTNQIKADANIVSMDGSQVDAGLTSFNQHVNEKELLDPNDFATGNRIEIRLGYAYSEEEFNYLQSYDGNVPPNMQVAFTGFVTACSVSTPLEVTCENMAHVLTTINVPNITEKGKMTIKDFLDDEGKFHLLKDTGISLSKGTSENMGNTSTVIEVSKFHISDQLTVADVLTEWNKDGIMSFMETDLQGNSTLRVGKVYYAGLNGGNMPTSDPQYISYNGGINQYNILQFDWDVAEDRLSLVNTDKKYLAVKALGWDKDGKQLSFVIRKIADSNGDWAIAEGEFEGAWSVVNQQTPRPKKARRTRGGKVVQQSGTTVDKKVKDKVDMSHYNVISYISSTKPTTKDKLMEEAKQYWGKYVPNGISGSISIFGDIHVIPSQIIGLIDPRQPQKNGYYMVESVNTTFGMDGFRREIKLPYKVMSFKEYPTYKISM